ncbi:protein-methionine sulfoxide oxidase mical2b isoform X3 [Hypomesus transpacificus]|uniref:protein-methionine sulfoxide oxidase mical2b isoform X3 n=1 Tax=Hypomesus transpacificus TaxID=137520 RepID=UPI001F07F7CA|nr:protein-methionine sulfoxide oxidase mical2b isoform X3 [Hypomesus transpacificus]
MGETEEERSVQAGQLFENFVQASTCKGTLQAFSILCRLMDLDPLEHATFYSNLKATVTSWKAKALWTKLDKRASQKEYNQSKACPGTKCLIIGGGPCGLRTSIELALLGAKVVVMEKRDTFSRNNVLHLWPYTIHDLRALGAKKFYGKFCAGAIDHISIRQLQLMLMKVALILGVEVHVNVEFVSLLEPPEQQEDAGGPGWRAQIRPSNHPISDFDFNVVIGADGRRNTLDGFRRKEFRGKLAIAITANFVNRNTTAEAKVEEISGVAFIFNQKFFLELKEETGIDLENIVYYKDNTHYFVMTAKKQSLLDKGVIIHDHMETEKLLSSGNVNQEALLSYAREAADFGTNYQLPSLDYAINPSGQPDVAMFDFTCMYASENAALARQKHGHQLLVALVGDSLLEPFWPMGTGCARGFLAAFDTAWMVRGWAQGKTPLEILAERESLYRLLPQTTTENISKNFDGYTVDPSTRYPNLNSTCVRPHQVRHLFVDGQQAPGPPEKGGPTWRSVNLSRPDAEVRPGRLLTWCQRQTEGYRGVAVTNLTSSWRNGLALCALIHHLRPELIDFDSLNEEDCAQNNQLAFDLAERELGIQAVTTGKEMALEQEPDKLLMVLYLSRFYDKFPNAPGAVNGTREPDENNEQYSSETANSAYSSMNQTQPRKRVPKEDKKLEESDPTNKRRRKGNSYLDELQLSCQSAPPAGEDGEQRENKVRSMATQLLAKFEERNASGASLRSKCVGRRGEFAQTLGGSDTCHFCRKRVYVMERLGAEGLFFHRECLRCDVCSCTLRLGGHAFDSQQGKFYCKMHYSQRRPSTAPVNFRKRADDQVRVTTSGDDTGQSTGGHARPRAQPGRGVGSPRKGLVPDVVEETLDTADGITGADSRKNENSVDMKAKAQDQKDVSKSADRSSRWKRRIRATLPLILVRTFQKGRASDKESTPIPEADSDYEEVVLPVSHNAAERPPTTQNALPGSEECPVPGKDITCSSSPKKKLIISVSEKEKLLDWNLGTLEEPSGFPGALGGQTTSDPVSQSQPPQPGQEPDPELGPVPTHPDPTQGPPPTAFQQLANALRRSLGMSGSASTAAVTRRAGPRRQRPLSEGAFNYSSMFGSGPPGQEERMREQRRPTGGDLTTLLEQVSLGRGQPGGRAFTDDMASLPPRRVNFFSSLRLKKRERGEGEAGEGEHIRTILSNIRNKASSQEQLDASYSSSDDDNSLAGQTDCPDKLKRRQERMVAQQAKTEQLKRLHRAQVIQRQLEEVGEKQRDLEERGVSIEKRLRGEETDDSLSDEGVLYQSWFTLVLEKNRLERYEEELMIFAQELELEDTQSRLQQELRRRMAIDDTSKSASELVAEQRILEEMMGVVERRDTLVSELEEQRLRERAEDRDLESLVLSKGYQFHWASE